MATIIFIYALIILAIAYLFYFFGRSSLRSLKMKRFAKRMGLNYRLYEKLKSGGTSVKNIISGEYNGHMVKIYDIYYLPTLAFIALGSLSSSKTVIEVDGKILYSQSGLIFKYLPAKSIKNKIDDYLQNPTKDLPPAEVKIRKLSVKEIIISAIAILCIGMILFFNPEPDQYSVAAIIGIIIVWVLLFSVKIKLKK